VERRTRFDLDRAQKRAHILEGLRIALDNIDEVIRLIRAAKDTSMAKASLMQAFELSEAQATAIVEMRLRSLTGLEREKIENEYDQLMQLIDYLTAILSDASKLYGVIKDELGQISEKFGDDRKTQFIQDDGEIMDEDLIDEETVVITLSHLDYVKRTPLTVYKSQNRGGRGVMAMQTREEDMVKNIMVASTHDHILYFTNRGRVHVKKAYEIPEAGRNAKGMAIVNLLQLAPKEKLSAIMKVSDFKDDAFIMMVTKMGIVKKTPMSMFAKINKKGIVALNFKDENDELVAVIQTTGKDEIFAATQNGKGLRFHEEKVRAMGRSAAGVRMMKLLEGDKLVGADALTEDCKILFVTTKGYGKVTDKDAFQTRNRGGQGVKIYNITEKTGVILGVTKVAEPDELMLMNTDGVMIRLRVSDIRETGRVASGVKLINLDEKTAVISLAKIDHDQIERIQTESSAES
jgi:DNA gyrase subunit A